MEKIRRYLMTGVSYMLPYIVIAGIFIAITGMINQSTGAEISRVTALNGFAWTVMDLIPAIFSAYIAYAIADKMALAPGFIGGYIAGHPIVEGTAKSGFLGAIVTGLLAGYLVLLARKIKFPEILEPIKNTLFIPVITGLIIYFIAAYPIAMSVGVFNTRVTEKVVEIAGIPKYAFFVGALLSAMCAFDMGGPVGKLAITIVFALWNDPSGIGFIVNAAVFPGIMIPGIASGLGSMISPRKYSDLDRENSITAIISGLVGITESALPYAFNNPIGTILPNVIGAAIAGGMMMSLGVKTSGVSGVFGIPMANNIPIFLLSIVVGVAIALLLQLIIRKDYVAHEESSDDDFEINIESI